MKKVLAVIFSAAMVLSCAKPSFADIETETAGTETEIKSEMPSETAAESEVQTQSEAEAQSELELDAQPDASIDAVPDASPDTLQELPGELPGDLPTGGIIPSPDDIVRVSIVLSDSATTDIYSTKNIASNSQAINYRNSLKAKQDDVTARIEKEVLGGKQLDVVWNITLVGNLISANVRYGDIRAIKAVAGVKDVVIERRYSPAVYSASAADPRHSRSDRTNQRSH